MIAAGIYYYRAFVLEQPPQVLIPKGTATEATAGTAEDGARLAAALMMPFNMSPPGAADPATTPPDLSNPPREFKPPDVTQPPLAIDANNGTADYGPLPTFAADRSPPVVGARFPPGMQSPSDKSDNTRTSEPQSSASQSSGNPASEAGQDSSGAPQGIADGMPVASSHNRQPLYPQIALRNGWEGVTLLKLDLDETGRVCAVRLLRSSGHELLDQKAIEAAKPWTYTPAMING